MQIETLKSIEIVKLKNTSLFEVKSFDLVDVGFNILDLLE